MSISLVEQSGTAGTHLTFTATVHNTGDAWDTYTVDLSDDLGWLELSFLPKIAAPQIYPTDAACVGDANGDIFIPSYDLFVGTSATGENWRTFLRFDVSSIPSGSTINSATLYARPYLGPYPYDDNITVITVDVKRVDNDDWDESTITWNNAPWDNVGAILDSYLITTIGGWIWNDWDVTSFVAGECAGDGVASILLQSENEGPPGMYVNYNQPEPGTSADPYLEVTYLGLWTTTKVTLGPGESATFDLGVKIDPAAPYCTKDTLTVVATSAYTETVVGTGSAKAHSMGVTRDDLFDRIMEIKGEWPLPGADQGALFQEVMDIKGVWPFAPE